MDRGLMPQRGTLPKQPGMPPPPKPPTIVTSYGDGPQGGSPNGPGADQQKVIAGKDDYLKKALAAGGKQADIDSFLANNPNDYHRINEALGLDGGGGSVPPAVAAMPPTLGGDPPPSIAGMSMGGGGMSAGGEVINMGGGLAQKELGKRIRPDNSNVLASLGRLY